MSDVHVEQEPVRDRSPETQHEGIFALNQNAVPTANQALFAQKTALVVSDNLYSSFALCQMLTNFDLKCSVANDSSEALKSIRK